MLLLNFPKFCAAMGLRDDSNCGEMFLSTLKRELLRS